MHFGSSRSIQISAREKASEVERRVFSGMATRVHGAIWCANPERQMVLV